MSFPKELNLSSNRPLSSDGRPSINRYRSDNSTYPNNDWIRIEIPTGRHGQYLFPKDSFLEGSVTVTCKNGTTISSLCLDQSVYSLFNRIIVKHGSIVIEDCVNVNKVWTSIMDVQINDSERRGLGITHAISDLSNAKGAYNSGVYGAKAQVFTTTTAITDDLKSAITLDFAFPLPSAILGTLSSKALPIGICGASSIYLELELASPNIAFVGESVAGATSTTITISSYTVSNLYYNAKITTLPSDIDQALLNTTGGKILLPAIAYKSESKNITAGSPTFNDKFSFQFTSIKSFYFFMMNAACAAGNVSYRSVSSRVKANLQEYYLTINGEAYPSQAISGNARMYAELLRSFDQLSDTNAGGILNYQNYTQSNFHTAAYSLLSAAAGDDGGVNTLQQRFLAGIDLDKFNHTSDTLMSGTSSIGQLVNLFLTFSAPTSEQLTLYAYVMYDILYDVEGGQITFRQ